MDRPPCAASAAARCRRKFVSGQLDEENPFVQNSSVLLVQPDDGVSVLVMDRIGVVSTAIYREESNYCNSGWSQAQVPARSENEDRRSNSPGARGTIARWPRDGRSHVARWPRDTSEVAGRLRYGWPRRWAALHHWLAGRLRTCWRTSPMMAARARRAMAPLVCATRCGDWWPDAVDVRRWLHVTAACWPARRRAALRDDARDRAPLLRRVKFFVVAAAGRPPLRRCRDGCDSEPEEVHFLMENHTTTEDEVFDLYNAEFTQDDLINALNEMVHEYRKLSQTFEEIKAENKGLKNSSVESSNAQLEDTDSLKTELSKLMIENDLLRNRSCELKSENERLNEVMSSWTKSFVSLSKLHETQKTLNDKSGLGFSVGESNSEGTSTQSDLAHDKFKKMNFVKASVIYNAYESVKYDDQNSGKLNQKCKARIGYIRSENSKPSWIKNRLEKDKAKAGSKSCVPNQSRRGSKKVKSVWIKVQPQRNLNGPHTKPKLNRSPNISARTLMDAHTRKNVKVIQVWVPKGLERQRFGVSEEESDVSCVSISWLPHLLSEQQQVELVVSIWYGVLEMSG
ncbi:hypothetical protein F511_22257 [Dorcoceras hygrometricum]|uniref:Uncharacterized protein n=1 Tax=Dorcoceras hygrometricum TaxID=472368 RepID=A0A2Z7CRK7_9LAMI|nr:hypothetical protein F511_22257 [Dorcoceras hygrometricum]